MRWALIVLPIVALSLLGCRAAGGRAIQHGPAIPASAAELPISRSPLATSATVAGRPQPVLAHKPTSAWVQGNLPKNFKGKPALGARVGAAVVVLYKDRTGKKRVLSVFRTEKERVLWSYIDYGVPIESALVPRPSLLACDLNGNDEPDLILCHSEDQGVGKETERWRRRLFLFVDGKPRGTPIELSGVDFAVHRAKDKIWTGASSDPKKPATRRDSVVIIERWTKSRSPRICVWSRILQYKTAKEEENGKPVGELLECEIARDGVNTTRYMESKARSSTEKDANVELVTGKEIGDKVFAILRGTETITLR